MSIYNDIKKVTRIPFAEGPSSSSFIRHSTAKRNPKIHKKTLSPRNANLYTEDDDKINDNRQKYNDLPKEIDESAIASSINEVNGGINYSNEKLEEHWKTKQIEASLNSSTKTDSNLNNSCNETEDIEDEEYFLRKCKLHKNAAIRGLLKNHIISLHDLQIPNKSGDVAEKECRKTHRQNENISSLNHVTEEMYSMKLVQYPEDPEVFVQPIHAYGKLDENEYKDIDFTVPRIGKKHVVTPRHFYVNQDDSGFDFVKKDAKGKKFVL
ncbi:uncharacterized protein LOC143356029 [Halictus rubicundus]|uniref:uncharacterized protein LOC143356029 n=1 Tax=Halictus rubicundus TaxID=77578 RepID=UPI0040371BA9